MCCSILPSCTYKRWRKSTTMNFLHIVSPEKKLSQLKNAICELRKRVSCENCQNVLVSAGKVWQTNITLVVVRRRWCHCSFERSDDHVIREPRYMLSYVFLECHVSSRQTIHYFARQVYILVETCVTLN